MKFAGVFSWQLPMLVQTLGGLEQFTNISRTLCPHNNIFSEDEDTCDVSTQNTPIVHLTSSSPDPIKVTIVVETVEDFYIKLNSTTNLTSTPSQPKYYFYPFDQGPKMDLAVRRERKNYMCNNEGSLRKYVERRNLDKPFKVIETISYQEYIKAAGVVLVFFLSFYVAFIIVIDLCYFNFLCAHPLMVLSDFNHVYSNLGYVLLGALFLAEVWHRQRNNSSNNVRSYKVLKFMSGKPPHSSQTLLSQHSRDFASHLLLVLMSNLFLYTLFYIAMKLLHRESIRWYSWVFIAMTYTIWFSSSYFYWDQSTNWALTPAQSRQNNRVCSFLQLYDSHDIWHFMSSIAMFFSFNMYLTIDDNLQTISFSIMN
ncbi:unnamed protein product [Leptidea sinapis]|uniref:Uncharacterized protein n=1 Tax=Leptidea sinapis TaxID=189913 RepID=A0A5E4R7W5_9NEOP|nr:unnamed protein product [Leptidea sinapis]